MKPVRLVAACAALIALAPVAARADDLCAQLGQATQLAPTGFGPAEGAPRSSSSDAEGGPHYWASTIQLSAGDNCSIEAHKMLTCAWEPSTVDDLQKMVSSVTACFPSADQTTVPNEDPAGPVETDFKLGAAIIQIGLTADVMTLNVSPWPNPNPPVDTAPAAADPTTQPTTP